MDPESDTIAKAILENVPYGGPPPDSVVLCGYVMVMKGPKVDVTGDDGTVTQQPLVETRLHTSPNLDQWIVLPAGSVLYQEGNRPEDDKRSRVWVDAKARLTHCRVMEARDVGQTITSAPDDPTAYPRGPK